MRQVFLLCVTTALLGCAVPPQVAYVAPPGPTTTLRFQLRDAVAIADITVVEGCVLRRKAGTLRTANRMLEGVLGPGVDRSQAVLSIEVAADKPHASTIDLDSGGNGNLRCRTALTFRPASGVVYEADLFFEKATRQCRAELYRVEGDRRYSETALLGPSCG